MQLSVNFFILLLTVALLSLNIARAEVPELVNYQGKLSDTNGEPLNGNYSIQFSIYAVEQAGSAIWSETHSPINVTNGIFNVLLGSITPFPTGLFIESGSCYLEIKVGEEILTPRFKFSSVPYSFTSLHADSANVAKIANPKGNAGGDLAGIYPNPSVLKIQGNKVSATVPNNGEVLKWNNSTSQWEPAIDESSGTINTSPRLSGNGTLSSPLDIAQQSANTGQVLKWNSTAWAPAEDESGGTLFTTARLTGDGTNLNPLDIAQQAAKTDQVLKWNGTSWAPAADISGGNPTGNAGGDLSGTYPDPTVVKIQNNSVSSLAPSRSNALIWDGSAWAPEMPDDNDWEISGSNVYRNTGGVGIGTSTLSSKLEIESNLSSDGIEINNTSTGDAVIKYQLAGSTLFSLGIDNSDQDKFKIGTSNIHTDTRLTIDATGNMGIGISNPAAKLDLADIVRIQGLNYGTWPGSGLGLELAYNPASNTAVIQAYDRTKNSFGKLYLGDGNVGIGTSNPAYKLQVINDETNSVNIGVYGYVNGNTGDCRALYGGSWATGTYGVGVYGYSSGQASSNYAGYFSGNVNVTGTLSKGGGSFRIDHPLDPANKYLSHSFVESPDMMNIYNGNVILDSNGEAWIELPVWFETLNRDFRYQLTCIGGFAQIYISEKIANNRFKIAGGLPGLEVSWQVTGIRQDSWAVKNRIKVEEDKAIYEKGKYLHPELFGLPQSSGIGYFEDENVNTK